MTDTNIFSTQLTSSAVVVWVIQWLKHAGWCPWITADSNTLTRTISAAAAIGTAAGIHFSFDAAAGSLAITGLLLPNILHFLWVALQQFVGQELIYTAVYNRK